MAAATFHASGQTDVADIDRAHVLLEPVLGSALAPTLFGVALLCCGLNSTVTATMAGQIVMEGFLDIRLPRIVTGILAGMQFALAGLLYLSGGMILTKTVNVPLNEALAAVAIPQEAAEARRIWDSYSGPWQFWNTVRTIVSGVTLALTGIAIFLLHPRAA